MPRVLMLVGAVVIGSFGCSDSTGPVILQLGGEWSFSESGSISALGLSCNASGKIFVNQSGQTFSGTFAQDGFCTIGNEIFDNSGTGTIQGGQINGNKVSFAIDICSYGDSCARSLNRDVYRQSRPLWTRALPERPNFGANTISHAAPANSGTNA